MTIIETWKPVVGYEDLYEVSDAGRIRSLDRYSPSGRHTDKLRLNVGRILSHAIDRNGYARITLYRMGHPKRFSSLHQIVAATFLGPRPPGLSVLHRDDDKSNNAPGNLYYGTNKDNGADRRRNGTAMRGATHYAARLTEVQVGEIVSLRGKLPGSEIARRMGVSPSVICAIGKGISWNHITGLPYARTK